MPEKIIETLTLRILRYIHTSISPIFSYKLYSVATPGHSKHLSPENYIRVIALTPDLHRVSFYSVIEFLYYNSTIELLLSLILIKRSYQSSRALLLYGKSLSALYKGCSGVQILVRLRRGLVPRVEATSDFWLEQNDSAPAIPSKFYPLNKIRRIFEEKRESRAFGLSLFRKSIRFD